jgi:hypothetical protein
VPPLTAATDPLPPLAVSAGGGACREVTCPGGLNAAAPLVEGGPASSAAAADDPAAGVDPAAVASTAATPKVATPNGAGDANADRGCAAAAGGPEIGCDAGVPAGSVHGTETGAPDTGTIGAATVAVSVNAIWYGRPIAPASSRREDASATSVVDAALLRCPGMSPYSIGRTSSGLAVIACCPMPGRGVNIDTGSGSGCR